mmetsp:Transcript_6739/g.16211  ORF Transcript_6739/g.16211 Transcript_6739/m.16211 type:complete len:224 (-) Transcript_6739:252-923(-)
MEMRSREMSYSSSEPAGTRLSPMTASEPPNPSAGGTVTSRRPPARMSEMPSSRPAQIAPEAGRDPKTNTEGFPRSLVSKITSPPARSWKSTMVRYPGTGCEPPPTLRSVYFTPEGLVISRSSETSFVPASSRATSRRVFTCSETTPKVRTPSQANPPASPKRRVKAVAIQSVESACRLLALVAFRDSSTSELPFFCVFSSMTTVLAVSSSADTFRVLSARSFQ